MIRAKDYFINYRKRVLTLETAAKFADLSREDQADYFIQYVSGQEKEIEIGHILAISGAYNLSNETAEKYELTEYDADELIELLDNTSTWDEENRAWNVFIDTIGISKIWDILDNIDFYIDEFNKINHLLGDLKFILFKAFASKRSIDAFKG
jgi:hypothetical protein